MAIFKSKKPTQQAAFRTKSQVIETLLKSLECDYPLWKVLESDEEQYDLILIRNIRKITTKYIKANIPDPFHDGKEEIVQIVIVVSIVPKNKIQELTAESDIDLLRWTCKHLITSDERRVLNLLEEIEEEQGK